ncbi:MAG: DUF1559 domain-containing protein [Planctomycetes bacterium]|nr:DUF1559 domain-containing protein [Planctomycetota bacterium]
MRLGWNDFDPPPAEPATELPKEPVSRGCGTVLALVSLPLIVCFLICAGIEAIVQVPVIVGFGWPWYLKRVVPQLSPDPWVVGTAIVCLVGFTLGSHKFLKWLYAASSTEPRHWRWKWTALLVGLVVLMFTAGIAFIGMIHQTSWIVRSPESLVRSSWEAAPRRTSANNLKQMGLATHGYHDSFLTLPQVQFDANGRAMHSWQTQLLPFLEQNNVYSQIDLKKPWNDPRNAEPMRAIIKPFLHPSHPWEPVNGYAVSHYAPNVHVVFGDTPRTLESFLKGTSNTILAGEVSGNFRAWGDPLNARDPRFGTTGHPQGFGGPNGKPAQFLMLDASVRQFDPKELEEALRMADPVTPRR